MYYNGGCLLNNMISTSFKGVYIATNNFFIYVRKQSDGKTLLWYAGNTYDNDHIYVALVY